MDLYLVSEERCHTHSLVVGAASYRQAALIAAEVMAENDPPGTGFVACIDKLCAHQGKGTGYYVPLAGDFRRYDIRPHKITLLPQHEQEPLARPESAEPPHPQKPP